MSGRSTTVDRQQGFEEALPRDVLIEEWLAKQDDKIQKEVDKAKKRFKENFNEEQYRSTSPRVLEIAAARDSVHKRFADALNANDLEELRRIILDCEIVCPISGTRNWTEVRQFNLMFSTRWDRRPKAPIRFTCGPKRRRVSSLIS